MAKKRTKKSVSRTKKVPRRTVGFPVKVVREIQALLKKHLGKKITLKEIRAMLAYLLDNYASVSYKNKALTIQTDDIYGHGRNVGPYNIKLDLKSLGGTDCHYYTLMVSPRGTGHVYSSGRMCFGDGWSACQKSVREGRLDDFVDMVQAILRTGE